MGKIAAMYPGQQPHMELISRLNMDTSDNISVIEVSA